MNQRTARPITLALSGGGAKCAAQAGVLRVFEDARLPVRALAGVSGGGIVAVLYGLGYSPEAIRDFFAETHLVEVWEFDPARRSLFGGPKTHAHVRGAVGDRTFADLSLPVTVVAAELATGRPVRLNSGRLEEAIVATMAVPGLFAPQWVGGLPLVDGGIVDPLPLDVARDYGQPVVAVDLLTSSLPAPGSQQIFETRGPLRYATQVARRLGLLEILETVHQTALVMTQRMVCDSLERYPPAVLLQPAVGHVGLFAFDLAAEAFALGEAAAREALPQLLGAAGLAAAPVKLPSANGR